MNTKFLFLLVISSAGLMLSCNEENGEDTLFKPKIFIDHGYIPADVSLTTVNTPFQSAIFHNGYVFVASDDGLWKNNLGTKVWSRAGFGGKAITFVFKHPTIENKIYAGTKSDGTDEDRTFHISDDGGVTWKVAENPLLLDASEGGYENYTCLAVRPDNPNHIYANMEGGTMIGISLDGGENWTRMNYEPGSYFGYTSNIVFLPNDPNHLFQGSENPLDDAWLARYDIDNNNPILLCNFTKIKDMEDWENRRPNELQSHTFNPNGIYVGQEGALSLVTAATSKFIFKSENDNFPYSYIYGIWVDPNDPGHIVFGGSINNDEQPMSLYETMNEGVTITQFEDKLGMENPEVMEIVDTNTYPAIIFNDRSGKRIKLMLYQYE